MFTYSSSISFLDGYGQDLELDASNSLTQDIIGLYISSRGSGATVKDLGPNPSDALLTSQDQWVFNDGLGYHLLASDSPYWSISSSSSKYLINGEFTACILMNNATVFEGESLFLKTDSSLSKSKGFGITYNSFTFRAWVDNLSHYADLFGGGNGGEYSLYVLRYTGSAIKATYFDADGEHTTVTTSYIATTLGSDPSDMSNLFIGSGGTNGTSTNGPIAMFAMWNRSLTDADVSLLGSDPFALVRVPSITIPEINAPQLTSPQGNESFNNGTLDITWNVDNNPDDNEYVSIDTSAITYEIQYTDNYLGSDNTVWSTITQRIPYDHNSYTWNVGNMVKSSSVRIRIRSKALSGEFASEWSMSGGNFSINVFKLLPPAVISPTENQPYADFILIILDDSLSKNTFSQKVRYTFEYSSEKQNIDWTVIQENLPFGTNLIRWNVQDLPASDDYILRVTAKNRSTCFTATETQPDQIAKVFVRNILIRHPGLFLIDTVPPHAVLKVENTTGVTNQLDQVIRIFSEDETTEVSSIQLRECDATYQLSLGNINNSNSIDCPDLSELLQGTPDLSNLIGKPISPSSKILWNFQDKSGLRKLEAMLTDAGGNTSIQESSRVFLTPASINEIINDFIIVVEQRDEIQINENTVPVSIKVIPSIFEVVYFGTNIGNFYVLEPFIRKIYTIENYSIEKLIDFNSIIYLFVYNLSTDVGRVYRHSTDSPVLLNTFNNDLSKTTGVAIFSSDMYIGLQNGELWKYNGSTFSLINTFENQISSLIADENYLYVGFTNSSSLVLYNGSSFSDLSL